MRKQRQSWSTALCSRDSKSFRTNVSRSLSLRIILNVIYGHKKNRLKSPLNEFFCTLNGDFASGIVEKTFDPSQPADPDRVLCLLICEA